MPVVVVVGAQWGDEGKGKVVDLLSERADVVVRYGGGANAGHTLVIDGTELVTHLVPSGVLHPGTQCVLADGMVIDPQTLVDEIAACRERGLLADDELCISERAHVVLPYHKQIEGLREEQHRAIGTTRRGIGPAYEAKAARRGVRIADLYDRKRLRELVDLNLIEIGVLVRHYGGEPMAESDIESMIDDAMRAAESFESAVGDAGRVVSRAIGSGANVLFEGAQGALLDIDHGTYPYVTSSSTIAGGACTGTGIGPTKIDHVIGITKAYCTRVGEGPFPTEMDAEVAEQWRVAGGEYGATTGRPRRCGWLDIAALRVAARLSGIGGFALTKLDVLRGRGTIRVCVGYRVEGIVVDELPANLQGAEPLYEELEGWDDDTRGARSVDELPGAAQAYIRSIEQLVGVPLALVSVGPDRRDTILLRDPFSS